jgi:hypothetical protein
MAHGDAREGKWRGIWLMEWVASTLHTISEHGVSSITTADAHTSAASSRLNWRPRRFKWTRPFRRKTKSGFCACAITFQTQSNTNDTLEICKWRVLFFLDPRVTLRFLPSLLTIAGIANSQALPTDSCRFRMELTVISQAKSAWSDGKHSIHEQLQDNWKKLSFFEKNFSSEVYYEYAYFHKPWLYKGTRVASFIVRFFLCILLIIYCDIYISFWLFFYRLAKVSAMSL